MKQVYYVHCMSVITLVCVCVCVLEKYGGWWLEDILFIVFETSKKAEESIILKIRYPT